MIRGSIYSKESLKSACKLKRENGKMQLNKKFRTDGVLLSVERWSFISDNLHLKYQTMTFFFFS